MSEPGRTTTNKVQNAPPANLRDRVVDLVRRLRRAGLKTSPGDAVTALAALTHVDLADPAEVRAALRAVLARHPEDVPVVDRALDAFFWGDVVRFHRQAAGDTFLDTNALPTIGPGGAGGPAGTGQADDPPQDDPDHAPPESDNEPPHAARAEPREGIDPRARPAGGGDDDGLRLFDPVEEADPTDLIRLATPSMPRPARLDRVPVAQPAGPAGEATGDREGSGRRDGSHDPSTPADEPGPWLARAGGSPGGYSPLAVLTRRDLQLLRPQERTLVLRAARRLGRWLATRPSRRFVRTRKGAIDGRRALREAARKAGDLTRWPRRRRRPDRPRLVCLLDVSGSMDVYSQLFLHFLYGLQQAGGRVETFAMGTRLTRLTPVLRLPRVDRAMALAAAVTADWSGGTRLGDCLWTLLQRYRGLLDGDTVLVVVSDGLDRGDLDLLGRCLRECRRRVRGLVWMNPLAGDPRYEPRAQGMQVALPYIDVLAPAHSVDSLVRLVDLLARRPRLGRRRPRSTGPAGGA